MTEITRIISDRLSTYRTKHEFLHYGEFRTPDEFIEYRKWAHEHAVRIIILGNGSNVLFKRRKIGTLVLKNHLQSKMEILGEGRIKVSSSLPIMKILKYCEQNALDSFYCMASVPATVGGAIAMNAGSTHETVFDFLDSITYFDGDEIKEINNDELERSHRKTMFTGIQDRLILSATFSFPHRNMEESEIDKRIEWSHKHQDLSAPNCGSVFRDFNRPIYRWVRRLFPVGMSTPFFRAQFSKVVNNWIINRNHRSWPIVFMIRLVQFIHRITGKQAILELIEVD